MTLTEVRTILADQERIGPNPPRLVFGYDVVRGLVNALDATAADAELGRLLRETVETGKRTVITVDGISTRVALISPNSKYVHRIERTDLADALREAHAYYAGQGAGEETPE